MQANDHGGNHPNASVRELNNAHANGQAAREDNKQRKARQNEQQQNKQRNARENEQPNKQRNAREDEQQNRYTRDNTQQNRNANANERGTVGQAQNGANARGQNQATVQQNSNIQQNSRVQLTSQDRTRIRDRVLSHRNVPRLNHVDFALHAGAVVPRHVHFVAISEYPTLVDVFPEYRDDYFVVAEDEIVVMTPQRRIVDVVPLRGSANVASSRGSGEMELSSTEIREVQQVLVRRGYDIEVDGVWGPATRRALVAFQEREGLPATGVITTTTVTSLGLRGKIAESHIHAGASTVGAGVSTTGQGSVGDNRNGRDNRRMNGQGQQRTLQRGQDRPNDRNANRLPNTRSTTGQGHDSDMNRPNKSTNGQGLDRSTTGQAGGPSGEHTDGQAHGGPAPSQGNMRPGRAPQR